MSALQRSARVDPVLVSFALAMGGFTIGTTEFATMSLMPSIADGLHVDEPTAGHVISAYAIGVVVGAPLLAVASAKLARRTLLMLFMTLFAIGNALSAVAPSYHWMLAFRFLSGVPHGAYFGIAALVAASLVPENQRAKAVSRVMLGLTLATVVGVPLANTLGRALGWRWSFGVVAVLAIATAVLVALFAPRDRPLADSSPLRELDALRRPQVWLTLGIGAVGFGGVFAVYTYLASTLTDVTHVAAWVVPVILCIFGAGMTIGNLLAPLAADRAQMPTAGAALLWSAVTLGLFPLAAHNVWAVGVVIFFIGCGVALATVLQIRLMDVAGHAQSLAAALNHSAFNTANAIGPWLGGIAIAAGYGWTSTGYVGSALALGGFAILCISVATDPNMRGPRRARGARIERGTSRATHRRTSDELDEVGCDRALECRSRRSSPRNLQIRRARRPR